MQQKHFEQAIERVIGGEQTSLGGGTHPGIQFTLVHRNLGQFSKPEFGTWHLPATFVLFLELHLDSQRDGTSGALN